MRRVRGEAFLTLALLNIFVLIAGFVTLDMVEARPLPAAPGPVTGAEGTVPADPGTSTPADPHRIAEILDDPMSESGLEEGLSGFVVDAVTGETLFERDPDTAAVPASTTKIATAIAALSTAGPDHRLATEVHLDPEEDRVVLRGSGDATLTAKADNAAYPQVATLEELAERTAEALEREGVDSVSLGYDDSHFTGPVMGPGWKPTYITEGSTAAAHALLLDGGRSEPDRSTREQDPPRAAADAFAERLEAAGIGVRGEPDEDEASGEVLAQVESAPVSDLVEFMMLASDNNMAESLGRLAALESDEEPDFDGAAAATHRVLDGLGVEGVELADNSGLSPRNRITPRALVEMVRLAGDPDHPELDAAVTGLPTANATGTLADRYTEQSRSSEGAGLVRGKTGTLDGVSSLAGTVHDQEGNVFVYAFVANVDGATGPQLDTVAAALAGCGCS